MTPLVFKSLFILQSAKHAISVVKIFLKCPFNLATVHFLQFLAYHLLIKKKRFISLKRFISSLLRNRFKSSIAVKTYINI